MSDPFDQVLHRLQIGEQLIACGVDQLFRSWQVSATVIGKLCTPSDRWQALFHQMQAPVNLADVLRTRTPLQIR
ncbi:MAG: hypothetical protein NVS1B6_04320 [Steroidobacteraceae bacterium]